MANAKATRTGLPTDSSLTQHAPDPSVQASRTMENFQRAKRDKGRRCSREETGVAVLEASPRARSGFHAALADRGVSGERPAVRVGEVLSARRSLGRADPR